MLTPGTVLAGRYEVVGRIGAGGMSNVYKARDLKLNRYVAIKVLKPEFSADETFVKKFRVEAQSAAGLSHPNIVNVYDVGEENGVHFIVMELVQGITLKHYIERKGTLDIREVLNISVQVASGMGAAHANRIIHRDIKPQNVIMSRDGKVKVTDFGIAKAADSTTVTTNAAGSVHYISPEQARGGYSDEKSDIYSLGITMYEMVTGSVPYDGENNVSVALQHIQGNMTPPRQINPDIPRSVERIILKCTKHVPFRECQFHCLVKVLYLLHFSHTKAASSICRLHKHRQSKPLDRFLCHTLQRLSLAHEHVICTFHEIDILQIAFAREFVEGHGRHERIASAVRYTEHFQIALHQTVLSRGAVLHDIGVIKLHLSPADNHREVTFAYLRTFFFRNDYPFATGASVCPQRPVSETGEDFIDIVF